MATVLVALLLFAGSTFAAPAFYSPVDPNIEYNGRWHPTLIGGVDAYQFDWPGFEIKIEFEADCISAHLTDNQNTYNVFIDNKLVKVVNTTSSQIEYLLACGLEAGSHQLRITKRTEPLFGISAFLGFTLVGGSQTILPPKKPTWAGKTEWIGDSITCGYGNEGVPPCSFTPGTENNYMTYEGFVSRQMNWKYRVASWSGRGVVRNYNDKNVTSATGTLPNLYPSTLANDQSLHWNFSWYEPDTVFINLGTNDYSTKPHPPQDVFEGGYVNFVNYIDASYSNPKLRFYLVCGPMIGNPCCQYIQNVVQQLSQSMPGRVKYINLQGILSSSDFGCDNHPSVSGHMKMAKGVLSQL